MADAQAIYERAIYLLGAEDEGFIADSSKNRDYKSRALAVINTLLHSLYPRFSRPGGGGEAPADLAAFSDEIGLDGEAALALLPLGLAGHLVIQEDPALSGYLLSRYEAEAARLARLRPASASEITDFYGGISCGGEA